MEEQGTEKRKKLCPKAVDYILNIVTAIFWLAFSMYHLIACSRIIVASNGSFSDGVWMGVGITVAIMATIVWFVSLVKYSITFGKAQKQWVVECSREPDVHKEEHE